MYISKWYLIILLINVNIFYAFAQYAPEQSYHRRQENRNRNFPIQNSEDPNYDSGYVERIQIGLFTDRSSIEMGIVFDRAIEAANEDGSVNLAPLRAQVNYGDSFQAYGELCQMLQQGIGGVFGPSSKHTAAHLMTVCDSKDIPYIFSHMTENLEGLNLYPQPEDMAHAIHSVLVAYEWERFIFLYESSEYLEILNGLLSLFDTNQPIITVLRYDIQMNGDYKSVLRRVRKSDDNKIVVVGSSETMPEFLKQAQQIGIINEDYKYIIGNLDFHSFDLEEYKYSEANITTFRMFSPEQEPVRDLMEKLGYSIIEEDIRNGSCPITMEMALLYDAVQLFAETTKHITFKPISLNCSERSSSVRDNGSSFRNFMRTITLNERTLTGTINFEGNIRKGFNLDVIELQPSGIINVGFWNEESNFTVQRMPETNSKIDGLVNSLANQTFIVLIAVNNPPYANIVENSKKLEGNNQYEGYAVDLIAELADRLGFEYILRDGGTDYGSFDEVTNKTTGMLKEITEGRAHLAISDITITANRQAVVDFSIQFMNLGISILFRKPTKAQPALFSFMDPFSQSVWVVVGLSFCFISICFFVLGRLSPKEWDNPFPCVEEPTELINQFTVNNSLWFTTGALLQQGCELEPKALSVRITAVFWWFFTLIMVSSYTANLAAFLTSENPTHIIKNAKDLSERKGDLRYGSMKTGSTRKFFQNTEDSVYKKMNEYMTAHPSFLTDSNLQGVNNVLEHDDYAFLMESTSIEYHTMRKCTLAKIGSELDEKGYGIVMPKDWPHRNLFNGALIELQEQGKLAKMKDKWWKEVGPNLCSSKSEEGDAQPLNMQNLFGVYFVMIIGSIIALFYAFLTWLAFAIKKAKRQKIPYLQSLKEEFDFVTDFHANTRVFNDIDSEATRSRRSSVNSLEDRASQAPEEH